MERVLLAVALLAVAAVIAVLIQRRRPDAPTAPPEYAVPTHLDRDDFVRPDARWLVVVFTSSTCTACHDAWAKAQILESDEVAVQNVEFSADRALHERYRIDGVPLVAIADQDGSVRGGFVGPATAADLWATMADLREPGSVPPGCDHGQAPAASEAGAADPTEG